MVTNYGVSKIGVFSYFLKCHVDFLFLRYKGYIKLHVGANIAQEGIFVEWSLYLWSGVYILIGVLVNINE